MTSNFVWRISCGGRVHYSEVTAAVVTGVRAAAVTVVRAAVVTVVRAAVVTVVRATVVTVVIAALVRKLVTAAVVTVETAANVRVVTAAVVTVVRAAVLKIVTAAVVTGVTAAVVTVVRAAVVRMVTAEVVTVRLETRVVLTDSSVTLHTAAMMLLLALAILKSLVYLGINKPNELGEETIRATLIPITVIVCLPRSLFSVSARFPQFLSRACVRRPVQCCDRQHTPAMSTPQGPLYYVATKEYRFIKIHPQRQENALLFKTLSVSLKIDYLK
ncbi:hypothetical protein PoB_005765500 [Plakobranchus ocellatus]|uniref:Uncharacterized protein n=1 Tax=Plakobranchus ocellatus TaxID=259542 RepID=A0AAV4CED4_9GAST|nr:hypothetical protein PoB_005765500 [Plakobranchus ocellatus]